MVASARSIETYGGSPAPDPVARMRMSYLHARQLPALPTSKERKATHSHSFPLLVRTTLAAGSISMTCSPMWNANRSGSCSAYQDASFK